MGNTAAIVGAGLIGRAWAVVFARAGWAVRLSDPHVPTLDAAPGLIRDELQALHAHGLVDDPKGAAARVSIAQSLSDAVTSVDFVQENGPETVEAKQALFAELDRLAPPMRSWPRRPRPSSPPASPRACPAAPGAWWDTRSTRRI